MSFDPNKPVDGSLLSAEELRQQFNGLKSEIDAVPAGPPGPQGAPGNDGQPGPQGRGERGLVAAHQNRRRRVMHHEMKTNPAAGGRSGGLGLSARPLFPGVLEFPTVRRLRNLRHSRLGSLRYETRAPASPVAQVSKPAVSPTSESAYRKQFPSLALFQGLRIGNLRCYRNPWRRCRAYLD